MKNEKIKDVDPSTLPFTPEYQIDVATVQEEYEAIANALGAQGCATRLINLNDDVKILFDALRKESSRRRSSL